MRTLVDHQVNPANDKLVIEVLDEPGHGGACHSYYMGGFDPVTNPSFNEAPILHRNPFPNGPISETG